MMRKAAVAVGVWCALSGGCAVAMRHVDDQVKTDHTADTDQTICYPLNQTAGDQVTNMVRHGWDVSYVDGWWTVMGRRWVAAPTEDSPVNVCVPEWHGVADDLAVTR